MILTGTLVNTAAILLGSTVGLLVQKLLHRSIPQRYSDAIMTGISLCVFLIAFGGILDGSNALITIFSMVFGGIIGEWLDLDGKIKTLSLRLEQRFAGNSNTSFSQAFMSTTLLFCVGAMAIKGSMDSGLLNDHATLYAKSMMDGISACLFASTMGAGVLFSAVSVFLYQGGITLLSTVIAPVLTASAIAEMNATGSLLLLGMALNMLGVIQLKLMNYVPAIFLPILFCLFL